MVLDRIPKFRSSGCARLLAHRTGLMLLLRASLSPPSASTASTCRARASPSLYVVVVTPQSSPTVQACPGGELPGRRVASTLSILGVYVASWLVTAGGERLRKGARSEVN
eukprot:2353861-Rhodomonas_salina.1